MRERRHTVAAIVSALNRATDEQVGAGVICRGKKKKKKRSFLQFALAAGACQTLTSWRGSGQCVA